MIQFNFLSVTFIVVFESENRAAHITITCRPTFHAVSVCVNVVPPFYHANSPHMKRG